MIHRCRILLILLMIWAVAAPPADALFNMNQGKDLVFVNATYSIGFDSNIFTRKSGKASASQSASASIDYTRQAGLIAIAASAAISVGSFASVRSQDFTDPSLSLSFRKRYGRTTGSLALSARHDSSPDPDAGERTKSWNYGTMLDVRYPVNDRYYLTNSIAFNGKYYTNKGLFSNLDSYSDSIFVNYIYSSKLDLNGGYTIRISDTSRHTNAYDHNFSIGASGGIRPKLSGTIRVGYQIRDAGSYFTDPTLTNAPTTRINETFKAFSAGTSLKWLYSRKLSVSGDVNEDFSISSTDISTDRLSIGLHTSTPLTTKLIGNFGVTYSSTDFLGAAGDGRHDDMWMFDASLGVALTTHIRTNLSYAYMINSSNRSAYNFERQTLTLTIAASY